MHLPGLSVIEAPRSVLDGGVPLMSTLLCLAAVSRVTPRPMVVVTPAVCTAERE